jgi:uncharacterized membrane protein YedE/YeeE
MKMPIILLSLVAGVIFGAGLAISDMINPERVLNFFDVAGTWDPTLLFVMGGALAVTIIGYRVTFARGRPLTGGTFSLPNLKTIDTQLIGGAAVFGVGWGIAGFCPGPAIAALVTFHPKVWLFVTATLIGMAVTKYCRSRRDESPAVPRAP